MKRLRIYIISTLALLLMGLFGSVANAQTCYSDSPSHPVGITPDEYGGNAPECNIKIDPPASGTYNVDGYGNKITIMVSQDPGGCGQIFTWTITGNIVIDHVYVKGGDGYNDYDYTYETPRPTTDGKLHAPLNPSGKYAGLSHINFCYHYKLTVNKTAATTFTRTWNWDIDKSVTPESWDLFSGDRGTSRYTVAVTKTGYTDSDWATYGTITIRNQTPYDAMVTEVTDVITPDDITAEVSCPSLPYSLASGGIMVCTYVADLPDGTNRTNTATVETDGSNYVSGNTATAAVNFGAPTAVVNASINVNDSNGMSWFASASTSWSYDRHFNCNQDEGEHLNTATIQETGQSDDATVTVNCNDLEVTKDAATSLDKTWNWTIDKTCPAGPITLAVGQPYVANYSVSVNATSSNSNWAVSGNIWVYNPAAVDAVINGVSDIVSPGIVATVSCPVSFPYTLGAGETLECTYSAALPNAMTRTNTATAARQKYNYNYLGMGTPNGTTAYSGTAEVNFSNATVNDVDECIDVEDNFAGALGTVCYGDLPQTFQYSYTFQYEDCGSFTETNTATFTTNDRGVTGSDNCTIQINVPCNNGCTLTQGYWKTHSEYGPAPYDDTWALLPNGADTEFFLSGQSWYEVFHTPTGGNAYYILAHQYMAAKLNILNGASYPNAVNSAINWAEEFFATYTPNNVPSNKRNQAISRAATLDQYNNGLIGPGHCSEDRDDSEAAIIPVVSGEFSLQPNPATDVVQINMPDFVGQTVDMQIFNQLGALVWSRHIEEVNSPVLYLQLDDIIFTNGVYRVSLINNGVRSTQTLMILRN